MIEVGEDRFEQLVADALDGIPEELGKHMDNVWIGVEDRPPGPLLGLYEGVPLTERGGGYGGSGYGGYMPDKITIYRLPICRISSSEEEVVYQVRRTVIHEVAHHFGMTDTRLRELGWG
ncbi:MAG: metallopeptidase family protein [Actinomycetota bacterium]|nr:metallopeptidase family protein [Actinomycetota bacterium]